MTDNQATKATWAQVDAAWAQADAACIQAAMSVIAAAGAIVTVVTALLILLQVREMQRANTTQALLGAFNLLQADKFRAARRIVSQIPRGPLEFWSQEQRDATETAINTYDLVGIMVKHGVIPLDTLLQEYKNGIINTYEHGKPMIDWNLDRYGNDYWDDFRNLYLHAKHMKACGHLCDVQCSCACQLCRDIRSLSSNTADNKR